MEKLVAIANKKLYSGNYQNTMFAVSIIKTQEHYDGSVAYQIKWQHPLLSHTELSWECEEIVNLMPSLHSKVNDLEIPIDTNRTSRSILFKYKEELLRGEITSTEHEFRTCLRLLKPKMINLADQCLANPHFKSKQYRLCKETGSSEYLKFRLTKIEHECVLRQFFAFSSHQDQEKTQNRQHLSKQKIPLDRHSEKRLGSRSPVDLDEKAGIKQEEPSYSKSKESEQERRRLQDLIEKMAGQINHLNKDLHGAASAQSNMENEGLEKPQTEERIEAEVEANQKEEEVLQICGHEIDHHNQLFFSLRQRGADQSESFTLHQLTMQNLGYRLLIQDYKARHGLSEAMCSEQ